MKNSVEACWLAGDPRLLNWEKAPLLCLRCKRDMPYEIDAIQYGKELNAFVKGWIFAMIHFALYVIRQDLTLEESEVMVKALKKRFLCSVDRGLGFEDFEETLENIIGLFRQSDTRTFLRAFGGSEW